MLATGGKDGNITVWDVSSGERRQHLEGSLGPVFSVAFSPDGTLLASTATGSPRVKLWEPSTAGGWSRSSRGIHSQPTRLRFRPMARAWPAGEATACSESGTWRPAASASIWTDGHACFETCSFLPTAECSWRQRMTTRSGSGKWPVWRMISPLRPKQTASPASHHRRTALESRILTQVLAGPVYPVCD